MEDRKHDGNGSDWRAGHKWDGQGIEYIDESDAIDSPIDGSEYGDTIPEMVDSTNDTDSSDGDFDESDGVEGGGLEGVYKWIEGFRNHWNDDRTETYRRAVREESSPRDKQVARNRTVRQIRSLRYTVP